MMGFSGEFRRATWMTCEQHRPRTRQVCVRRNHQAIVTRRVEYPHNPGCSCRNVPTTAANTGVHCSPGITLGSSRKDSPARHLVRAPDGPSVPAVPPLGSPASLQAPRVQHEVADTPVSPVEYRCALRSRHHFGEQSQGLAGSAPRSCSRRAQRYPGLTG
jgi:hypothetical protein